MTEQERAALKKELLDDLTASGRFVTRDYCDREMKARDEDISEIKTNVAVACTKLSVLITLQKIIVGAIIGAIVTGIGAVVFHIGG